MIGSFGYKPSYSDTLNAGLKAFALSPVAQASARAWAYYEGSAYGDGSSWGRAYKFEEWDSKKYGDRPIVHPFGQQVANISAALLFGRPPRIQAGDPAKSASPDGLQVFLDDWVLTPNRILEELLEEAKTCVQEGGVCYKFAWTPQNASRPIAIMTHSPSEVTWFRDPLDADQILKCRIQFKYCDDDGMNKKWFIYREEWTDTEFIEYKRLETEEYSDVRATRGLVNGVWPSQKKKNPFGVIPVVPIYNIKVKGCADGLGDYWSKNCYDLWDRYNYTCWLETFSDQSYSDPVTVFTNATDAPPYMLPGMVVSISGEWAGVTRLSTDNPIRPHIRASKMDLRSAFFDAVGYDDVDPSVITNKGALTRAVWDLVFHRSKASTEAKRIQWRALEGFFEKLLEGLSRLPDAVNMFPCLRLVDAKDKKAYDVSMIFPDLFETTPEERSSTLEDLRSSVLSGLIPISRAREIALNAWGIYDLSGVIEELMEEDKTPLSPLPAEVDAEKNPADAEKEETNV